jgi:hypothetical protein
MPDHLLTAVKIGAAQVAPSTLAARNSQCFVVQLDGTAFFGGAEHGHTDNPALPLEQ